MWDFSTVLFLHSFHVIQFDLLSNYESSLWAVISFSIKKTILKKFTVGSGLSSYRTWRCFWFFCRSVTICKLFPLWAGDLHAILNWFPLNSSLWIITPPYWNPACCRGSYLKSYSVGVLIFLYSSSAVTYLLNILWIKLLVFSPV